jgi:hypothetical protein
MAEISPFFPMRLPGPSGWRVTCCDFAVRSFSIFHSSETIPYAEKDLSGGVPFALWWM